MRLSIRARAIVPAALAAALSLPAFAQQAIAPVPQTGVFPSSSPEAEKRHGRLLLVLPFENNSAQQGVEWIGEAVPEVLNRRLASAGFLPISRTDRVYALDHLGLPVSFRPSRASTLRLAQTLDADYVILGSYNITNNHFTASARILDVAALKLGAPLEQKVDLDKLLVGLNGLAWQVARQLDPTYPVAEQTFMAASASVRLDTFENFVRGVSEGDASERIRRLKEALRLNPTYAPALAALGRAYFNLQQYELAASTFAKLPRTDPAWMETEFYRGLALFYSGSYPRSEEAFAAVGSLLPLPEVINNQAVAISRRGRDGAALFQQAVTADPSDADYHFNLAVSLRHRGDIAGALKEAEQALHLHANDSEAQALLNSLRQGALRTASGEASEPLERIKRGYNEAAFRQAALEIEDMQALHYQSMPPAARAEALTQQGNQYLSRGLILEAEREYLAASAADATNANAVAGLAEVRERSGDKEEARKQAETSIHLTPNVRAYLVLARLSQAAGDLSAAAEAVSSALRVDAANPAARGMKQALEARGQQVR